MSAEILRKAAALVRGNAHPDDDWCVAVADWLDTVAERLIDSANTGAILGGTDYEAALAVAHAYLGETS